MHVHKEPNKQANYLYDKYLTTSRSGNSILILKIKSSYKIKPYGFKILKNLQPSVRPATFMNCPYLS